MNPKLFLGLVFSFVLLAGLGFSATVNDIFFTNVTGIADFGVGKNGPLFSPNFDTTNFVFQLFDFGSATNIRCVIYDVTNTNTNPSVVGNVTVTSSGTNRTCDFGSMILKKGDKYNLMVVNSSNPNGGTVNMGYFNVANPYPINKTNVAFINGTYYMNGNVVTLYSANTMSTIRNVTSTAINLTFQISATDVWTTSSLQNLTATISPSYSLNQYVAGFWNLSNVDTTSANGIFDSSFNGNNGNASGYVTNNGTVSGGVTISDGAMVFDGVNGRVNLGDIANYPTITLEAWIYPTSAINNQRILGKASSSGNFEYQLILLNTNQVRFGISTTGSNFLTTTSNTSVSLNQWNHIVAIHNGTNQLIYINNVLVGLGSNSGNLFDGTNSLGIGCEGTGSCTFFNGSINARIYSQPINTSQITSNYNAGYNSYSLVSQSLIGQYSGRDFLGTEASPTTILDKNMIVSTPDGGTAWTFDGVNDFISLGDKPEFDGFNDFTIRFNIRFDSLTLNGAGIIDKYLTSGNQRGWRIYSSESIKSLTFQYSTNGQSGTVSTIGSGNDFINQTSDFNLFHIVRINSTIYFYRNGELFSSTLANNATIFDSTAPLIIGKRQADNLHSNISLDGVYILKNKGFTPEQVAEDYARGGFTYPIYLENETFSTTNGLIEINDAQTSVLRNITVSSDNYFLRAYTDYNISSNLQAELTQAVVQFTPKEIITNLTLTGGTFTVTDGTTTLTASQDTVFNLSAGTYNVTYAKSGYFNKTQEYTFTALSSNSVDFSDVGNSIVNITLTDAFTSISVTSFTINSTLGSYTRQDSTTNGSIIYTTLNGSWLYTVDTTGYVITSANWTVNESVINNVTLSAYTSESVYFQFFDEETNVLINFTDISLELIGSISSYNYTVTNGTYYAELLTPDSYIVRYGASGYGTRFGYLTVSEGTTQGFTLYLLNQTSATNITRTVIDSAGDFKEGALVKLLKYNLSSNSYVLVEQVLSDYVGNVQFTVEFNAEFYKFLVEFPIGTVVLTTSPAYIIETTGNLVIPATSIGGDDYFYVQGVAGDVYFNSDGPNFGYTYSDSNSVISQACMDIYRVYDNLTTLYLGSACSSSYSATLLFNVTNTTGNVYYAKGFVTIDGLTYYVDEAWGDLRDNTVFDQLGLVIAALLTITLALILRSNPALMIATLPIGVTVTNAIGITYFTPWVPLGLWALSITLAMVIGRYS